MKLIEALIALMFFVDKKVIPSRTTIQKILYFSKTKGLINATYIPYYYGPYSIDVHNTLVKAVLFDFIKEDTVILSDNIIRYEYELTQDGRRFSEEIIEQETAELKELEWIIDVCYKYSRLDYQKLANAAKIHFVLSTNDLKREDLNDHDAIKDALMLYGWRINGQEITEAKELLRNLKLL